MTFSDPIPRESILKAISEFKDLGGDEFLKKYHFGRAKKYFLVVDRRLYDSKAIVGVAHGYEYPDKGPLTWRDFQGGKSTVKPKLEELGFEVWVLQRA